MIRLVIVLVLGYLSKESKAEGVSLTQSCTNETTTVNCSYQGNQTLVGFKWYVDGVYRNTVRLPNCSASTVNKITEFTPSCHKNKTITLTVKDPMMYAGREKQQTLTCLGTTQNKTVNTTTEYIKVHPRLDTNLKIEDRISTKIDLNVNLKIKVVALPPPKFTWYKKSGDKWQPITSHANMKNHISKLESTLIVFRVLPADVGMYKVRAENDCGSFEQLYELGLQDDDSSSTPGSIVKISAAGGCLLVIIIVAIISVKLHRFRKLTTHMRPRQVEVPRKSIEPHYCTIDDSKTEPLGLFDNNATLPTCLDKIHKQDVQGNLIPYPSASSQPHIRKNSAENAVANKHGKGEGKSVDNQKKSSENQYNEPWKDIVLSIKTRKDKADYVNHVHGYSENVAYSEVKQLDTSL